jgi:hypothetical protein
VGQLAASAYGLLMHLDAPRHLGCSSQAIASVIRGAVAGYHHVPFHSFRHGFACMQFAYYLLVASSPAAATPGLTDLPEGPFPASALVPGAWLSAPLEAILTLLAALLHDLDHPGHGNMREARMETARALCWPQATLEHHHATAATALLDLAGVWASASREERVKRRQFVTGAILATDMGHHADFTAQLSRTDTIAALGPASTAALLVHSADIAGQLAALPLALRWEQCVSAEFARESCANAMEDREDAAAEGKTDLPPLAAVPSFRARARGQAGFLRALLVPWWQQVGRLLPGMHGAESRLHSHGNYYSTIADSVEEAQAPVNMASTDSCVSCAHGGRWVSPTEHISLTTRLRLAIDWTSDGDSNNFEAFAECAPSGVAVGTVGKKMFSCGMELEPLPLDENVDANVL